ncbi:hypothetical protein [Streptacidiphilus rugosus]|uniref:hypothetical protein n=1 Tax=Streptacidiphilus rugosus TaxID=405783 RepID=UPI000AD642AA|nr:hypothetical protein [Streptacidiphilus rugosus]
MGIEAIMETGSNFTTLDQAARQGRTAVLAGFAAAALEALACGRRELRAVRHPLGFVCLPVLREGGDGVCVHLHGGPEAAETAAAGLTTSTIHAHSWDLASCVLFGEIGNVPVRVHDVGRDRATHRVFEVHSSASGVDELRPTSRLVRWSAAPTEIHGPRRIYRMASGEFHSTVEAPPRRGPSGWVRQSSATVVVGRSAAGRTDLALGPLHGLPHQVQRRHCSAPESADIALRILRRMNESEPRSEPSGLRG